MFAFFKQNFFLLDNSAWSICHQAVSQSSFASVPIFPANCTWQPYLNSFLSYLSQFQIEHISQFSTLLLILFLSVRVSYVWHFSDQTRTANEWCRFVEHIGQGKKRGRLWEQPSEEDAWGGSCFDLGGQLAAHQGRRGRRSGACCRNAFDLHGDCAQPFHCGGEHRSGWACGECPAA